MKQIHELAEQHESLACVKECSAHVRRVAAIRALPEGIRWQWMDVIVEAISVTGWDRRFGFFRSRIGGTL